MIAFFDRMILGKWVRYKNNTAYLHQIPPCSVSKSSLVCDKRKETAAYFYRRSRDSCASFTFKHKEPINRVKSRGLLALRLCVGLFLDYDFQLFNAY